MQSMNAQNRRVRTLRAWNILACLRFAAACCVVLTVFRAASAAPPDFAQVPADSVWIVHADFDALNKSTVYQKLSAAALSKWKPLAAHLAKVNRQLGMNLTKDLHGMTVCGPSLAEPKASLIMHADWDPQVFRQKLALAPSHEASTVGQYEIHRFARQDEGQLRTVAGACWRPGTFIFSHSPSEVQAGLEVLDGKKPHLADGASGKSSALAADVPTGTVFMARMVMAGGKLPVESPVLKQTDEIDLACGENSGECFARAKLVAKTAEDAAQVKKAVDGILVIVRLHAAGDAKALKALDHLAVSVDGRTVQVDFRVTAADLATVLEKAIQEIEQPSEKKDKSN
jgi:hypothetical protein